MNAPNATARPPAKQTDDKPSQESTVLASHSTTTVIPPRRERKAFGAKMITALVPAIGLAVGLAAPATADPAPEIAQVIASARGGVSCGALNYNPTVEKAADIVNRSTHTYLNHTAENVPADNPHPVAIVKDLGINTDKVSSLQGAAHGHNESNVIKGILLQGRKDIPDCTYTDYGVSLLYEPDTDFTIGVVVLVGK
ncbi:hypothetical protein ACJH6J_27520 [Mycobacterium sp. SMC-18]|uniref:hypothetical protein n=1 Tax=Mycobacterium sp. SMC-18 TaxID=3381629 RepID=UPI0038767FD8